MSTRTPVAALPLLGILLGSGCLAAASIYSLAAPGFSFRLSATSNLTQACNQTPGCASFVVRRDQALPAIPGVQVTFVTLAKLTPSSKDALKTAVDEVVTRPDAVTVDFVLQNPPKKTTQ